MSEMHDLDVVVRYDHAVNHLDRRVMLHVLERAGEAVRRRRQGKEVCHDSKYTGRKRSKVRF